MFLSYRTISFADNPHSFYGIPESMKQLIRILLLLPLLNLSLEAADPPSPIPATPQFRIEETLISYRGTESQDYLAFPAVVSSGDQEILISYKRGESHARDPGAVLEIIRFDLENGRVTQDPIQVGMPDAIMQMGEWVRFPDGSLASYIDVQKIDENGQHYRTGLMRTVSHDNGKTFSDLEAVGVIDGIEYGYLFDTATIGNRVYALIMTFEYLTGGRRTVDALYTDDNGSTWNFINNLSQEFGNIRINESSLIPYEQGFLVATRGYDDKQRLHRVDINFNVIKEADLTANTPSMASYLGRPRIFTHEDNYFLIGRNWRAPYREIPMEQSLVRFDPENLTVEKQFSTDNVGRGKVTDGYYPCPVIVETSKQTLLNVFDYKALLGNPPDIVRFQFPMSDFLK